MKNWWFRLMAVCLGLLLGTVVAEMNFRHWLFSDASVGSIQRSPHFYADYRTDDLYWKLYRRWGPQNTHFTLHSKLGWVGNFNPNTFRHYEEFHIRKRQTVLMFGDSFVSCEGEVICFEELLDQSTNMTDEYGILNYGVGGYGIDQIFLLMKEVLPLYPDAIVVIGIMTMDIDRAHLSVREAPKPRFVERDGAFFVDQPEEKGDLEVPSLLYRRLLYSSVVPQDVRAVLQNAERVQTEKSERTRWIIKELGTVLSSHRSCVVLFDPFQNKEPSNGWRMRVLEETFTEWGPNRTVRTSLLLKEHSFDALIQRNGHPTTLYNQQVLSNIVQCIEG